MYVGRAGGLDDAKDQKHFTLEDGTPCSKLHLKRRNVLHAHAVGQEESHAPRAFSISISCTNIPKVHTETSQLVDMGGLGCYVLQFLKTSFLFLVVVMGVEGKI